MTTAAPASTWSAVTTLLAESLPNFESRSEQDRLAVAIEDALDSGEHLLGQAGCGTGKSFAYLATAVAHAKRTRKPVVVATATKGLQGQIAAKDAPFLATVLHPLLGEISIVLLKGRGNYLCLDKFNGDAAEDLRPVRALREELEAAPNHTGDMDTFITEITGEERAKLVSSSEECPGKKSCPFGNVCFAEKAKEQAMNADIVVTNHALLMRDAVIREATNGVASLLPEASAFVIDEAHELEEYARGALGSEVTDRTLIRFADDVASFLRDEHIPGPLQAASRTLFTSLGTVLAAEHPDAKPDASIKAAMDEESLANVGEDLVSVMERLAELDEKLVGYRPADESETMQKRRLRQRLANLDDKVRRILMAEDNDLVRWVERDVNQFRGNRVITVKLAFQPIEVGEYLSRLLWEHTPGILVSATLALGDDFSFIARSLGLDESGYISFDAGTPFDFAKQSALYIPSAGFPEPTAKREEHAARTQAEIGELVTEAGGRSLLLFTSRRAMNAAYDALAPRFQRAGLTVLRQGDAPAPALVEAKKADPTSVLFALRTFMTGVDFQGDCVRMVVIDKLPFPVPDDVVFAARSRLIDARARGRFMEKSFMKLAVPTMALTLFQAHGRGVRTKTDEALIVIFDPRLRTKSYGKNITRALPRSRDIDSLRNAIAYLHDLAERRDAA